MIFFWGGAGRGRKGARGGAWGEGEGELERVNFCNKESKSKKKYFFLGGGGGRGARGGGS